MHQRRLAWLVAAVITLLAFAVPQSAQAITITFDDIPDALTNTCCSAIPEDYEGMIWQGDGWIVYSDEVLQVWEDEDELGEYDSPSGEFAASNNAGMVSVTLTDGADFDFISAMFRSHGSTTITVKGYNNDVLVGTVTMNPLPQGGYEQMNANLMGVDELHFISSAAGEWWLMDDLTLNAPTLVPEPGTVLLMGSGLLGLAYQGRKRRA